RDDNSITWFQSSGGPLPSFAPRLISNVAAAAVSVDVGDVDRDGDADVVSASEDDDRILLHINDGRGNFATAVVRPGAPQPDLDFAKSVRLVDLENDGDLDIAYASEDQNEVGWYVNNGARPAAFAPLVITAGNAVHVKYVSSADMDGDGDADLLSAWSGLLGQGAAVLWHRNNGQASPTFTTFVATTAAIGARYVHAADLDSDGDSDLLTASRDDGRILWFRNGLPHRTAQIPATGQRTLGNYASSRHLVAADLDGDGDRDQISVGDRDLVWHENNGAQPPAFAARPIANTLSGPRWVDTADLDRDGDVDLLVASTNNGTVYWYENNGARPPAFAERVAGAGMGGPRTVVHADLDRDGDMDLAVPSDEDSKVFWFENNGARPPVFTPFVVDQQDISSGYFRTVWPADMDRDGDVDLVSASANGGQLLLYTNNGARPPVFARREIGSANYPQHVHVDDVDGDGDPDILLASELDNALSLFENLDGRAGSFARRIVDGDAPQIHAVVSGDADADGDVDLFAAVEGNNSFAWYESNGGRPPAFGERLIYNLAIVAHSANVGDLDGDGDLEFMGAARENGLVAWFENQGGHYGLNETGFGQRTVGGRTLAVTTLQARHLGRAGDAPIQIATLDVRFQNGAGAFLSTSELVARVRTVSVYADALANGQFDPGADRLLVSEARLDQASGGRLVVSLRNAAPPANLNPGGSATLFVVAELNGACSADGVVRPLVRPTA
ncbi:MAG: FG-GAP repeat domain-containing protein, partial [Caldilineaceae bacterium]